jgi:hypothetical protein
MSTKSFRLFAAGAALATVAVLPACVPHSPGGSPPPRAFEGQERCEFFSGTFAVGTGSVLWTCTDLETLTGPAFLDRADALDDACTSDGGNNFSQAGVAPQDATCSL